ncbi:undecaprenyldiphospho-muramoylpentapeptide beta-N-acetylglucosaminyltransferase [bacterium]|nr:undecaprenyldiphospho-muramoylpentapeptide beta-N-acetylglucosaminyltransferase [bacterium]
MKKQLKVLISGGGTGGHIFPAVAIANAVKEKYPDAEISFVGAQGKMEMEKVPAEGYPITGLWISGLNRKLLSADNFALPFKLISSLWKSFRIVKKFKPDVTVGVGGFASGPLNYMASTLGIPLLLQEQNSYPGITNKLLKSKAKTICVAYEGMEKYFPKDRIVITGNPIRQALLKADVSRDEAMKHFGLDPQKKTVLFIGGSLGARTINRAVEAAVGSLPDNVQFLWQTGKHFEGEEGNFNYGKRTQFIKRMDLAYKAADLVVSRAGALSISEISALGKACIFVPSPNVTEDHQTKNAMNLVERDAALLCKDVEAGEQLIPLALSTLENEALLKQLQSSILHLGKPNATEDILKELEKLVR